jgi:O-antigen/teichoic acid export membrane protein
VPSVHSRPLGPSAPAPNSAVFAWRRVTMGRTTLPRIAANVVSLLSNDVMNRATTFLLYALVARYLGAFEFGQLSLALVLFYTFQVLAAAGLKTLITREVARDRTRTNLYLLNGILVATGASALAMAALAIFVQLMAYSGDTASVILLLSLGLLPFALSSVCEAVFQAHERMHYVACANLPVNLGRIGLGLLILHQGYGVYAVVVLLMASYAALALIEWSLLWRFVHRPVFELDIRFAWALVRSTATFLGIDVLIAISASLNVILLSKLADETDVGLYNAAVQLLAPMMLVLQNMVLSVFPLMCRRLDSGVADLKLIAEQVMALLFVLVLPVVIGVSFLADSVLLILYANRDFLHASEILRLAIWGLIPTGLMSVLGYVLMASHRERLTLGLVAAHAIGNVVLGYVLISQLGVRGAVALVLLDKLVGLVEHYLIVRKLVARVDLARVAWRPVVAGSCLAACLAVVRDDGIIVSVLAGGVVYLGVLMALIAWSMGGVGWLRTGYTRFVAERG